jgi:hypothetical protein
LCRFVKKHGHHVTLKILMGRFSRNFSRTPEGIELKSGIYSTQCVGLVSTNQDNSLGPHKKHLCQAWLNSVRLFSRRRWKCCQIWISEMLQYYPELEVVELVQDGQRFFWDHLLPTAHVDSFLHYLAVSYKWWPLIVLHSRYSSWIES